MYFDAWRMLKKSKQLRTVDNYAGTPSFLSKWKWDISGNKSTMVLDNRKADGWDHTAVSTSFDFICLSDSDGDHDQVIVARVREDDNFPGPVGKSNPNYNEKLAKAKLMFTIENAQLPGFDGDFMKNFTFLQKKVVRAPTQAFFIVDEGKRLRFRAPLFEDLL
jgi:hypothetical protein